MSQSEEKIIPYKSFFETPMPSGNTGIKSWLLTYDHKRIGILYLCAVSTWFIIGAFLGALMRLHLINPVNHLFDAQVYNSLFTLHGVIMVFLFIIPGIPTIFGNFLLPMQIGADDVFFPKLNLFTFYLYLLGGAFAIASLFLGDGPPDTGWTFYVPFSTTTKTNVVYTTLAAFILGMSSILTGLNFVTTVHRMRVKGMKWLQIPLFTWSIYATAWVQILATPVVGMTLLMIIGERLFGLGFFDPAKGGDPVLYQHLFWLYSHPAVYIMILPAMGVISEIIPVYARKSIFGYKAIVVSSMTIAIAGSLVWAHHMYTSGMSDISVLIFSLLTFVVAIPSAVKVFNWVATLYKGSIQMSPALFLSLCFIALFTIGGLTGLILGSVGTDIHVHDTQFVVGHFHFVMFGGAGFAFFAALHHWWPKMFGRLYDFKNAYIASTLLFIGFVIHFLPMMIMGLQGLPRRYYTYLPRYTQGNVIAAIGGSIMLIGLFFMIYNLLKSLKSGALAPGNPWGGTTLDWQQPSPPPLANFMGEPKIGDYPYDFSKVKADLKEMN